MLITPETLKHLRDVLYHKLSMWDAAHKAEKALQLDIDTAGDHFDYMCSGAGKAESAYTMPSADVLAFFFEEEA